MISLWAPVFTNGRTARFNCYVLLIPKIKRPRRFGISVLMLFIVPDQRTVRITQGNRVNIAVVFFVVEFVDDVVLRAFAEPRDRSLNQFLRVRTVTGKQALSDEFFSAAPIILLDEPSASLDPIAEHQIFEDFSKISENKSAVLISHRLSSITLADKILVLEDGHIIEQGSHADLLRLNGRYAHLFNLQASKYS